MAKLLEGKYSIIVEENSVMLVSLFASCTKSIPEPYCTFDNI